MDSHLNLFYFFNDHDSKHIENNLSRAFAICLKHDNVFLDRLLLRLLPKDLYERTFNSDYPDHKINIDLQKRLSDLSSFEHLIAVATITNDTTFPETIIARDTADPITDVIIEINNILIIFEFKRTEEECFEQLENQVNKVKETCGITDSNIQRISFSWLEIMSLATNIVSFQKQINQVNPFIGDFVKFIELKYAEWLPTKMLYSISFPKNPDDMSDPNSKYLDTRLNQLKKQINLGDLKEIGGRIAISVNYGWTSEINLLAKNISGNEYITLNMWTGDTKGQGKHLFKPNKSFVWFDKIMEYDVDIDPYFKFSHFNAGIAWLGLSKDESRLTHNYDFFQKNSGRWKKGEWKDFKKIMIKIIPDWETRSEWESKLENTNRTYFDLSMGYAISVKIPFKKAQKLDNDSKEISPFAVELHKCAVELRNLIDNNL